MSSDVDQWADAGLKALQQSTAEQVRASVSQALPVNPDKEAETRRFAAAANVPLVTARALPDVTKVQAQMSGFDADVIARQFPTTAQLLAHPDLARIAHDDIPKTTQVEQAATALAAPQGFVGPPEASLLERAKTPDFWSGIAKYIFSANPGKDNLTSDIGSAAQTLSAKIGTSAALAAGAVGMAADAGHSAITGKLHTEMQDAAFGVAKPYADVVDSNAAAGANDAFHNKLVKSAATLGLQLPMMLAGGAGGSAVAIAKSGTETLAHYLGGAAVHGAKAMALPALIDATDMMRKVYEKTGDLAAAARAGQAQFALATAGGIVPLNAPGALAARLGTGSVVGALQGELSRQGMNAVLPDSMQTAYDPEESALSAVTGGLTAGALGPHSPGNRAAAVRAFNEAFEVAKTEGQNAQVVALGKAAATSKLRERDPAAFKQFVKDTVDQGDSPKGLFVDAHELNRILTAHEITAGELNQTMPDVAAQLQSAMGEMGPTNGLVRIPIEDFATHIAGSPLEEPLLQHFRVTPEGGTVAESEAYHQGQVGDLKAQAERLTVKNAGDQAYQDSLNRVTTDTHARLEAIGMKPDVAVSNAVPLAAFYQVHADRLGVLPHEFAERYPVNFSNKALEGLEQSAYHGTPHEVSKFTTQKIGTGEGNQAYGWGMYFAKGKDIAEFYRKQESTKRGVEGNTYKVEVPEDHQMLDYHARVGEQSPSVQAALTKLGVRLVDYEVRSPSGEVITSQESADKARLYITRNNVAGKVVATPSDMTGARAYKLLSQKLGGAEAASRALNDAGVPGLRYLDAGSRGDKAPTKNQNFVIFDDSHVGAPEALPDGQVLRQDASVMRALPLATEKVDGLTVRKGVPNMGSIESSFENYEVLPGVREVPFGMFSGPDAPTARTRKLAKDIGESQEIAPLIVAIDGVNGPYILEGAHRYDALQHMGKTSFPAVVVVDKSGALAQDSRGTFSPSSKTISVLKGADLSTFQHELGHFFLDTMAHLAGSADAPASVKADMHTLLKWFGVPGLDEWYQMPLDEQRESHEKFATGWETYLMRGDAPTLELRSLFQRFRSWMLNVYKSLKGAPGDFTPEVKGVFDRMIASEDAIAQAEQARRYMPLFDSPEKSGLSAEEWTAYQALGKDATEKAVEGLVGKTMKDMAWTDRLRTASLKAVTREAREQRTAVENEVKSEVMRQPVYRAWSFLTGKDSAQLPDEANAAHRRDVREWNEQRTDHETETRTAAKDAAWAAAPASKETHKNNGLAKGRFLSKNRASVDLEIQKAMDAYDAEHPKPATPAKPEGPSSDPLTGAGKLNSEALKSAFGEEVAARLYEMKMTGKKGIDPGTVADMFGFPDAASLVKALVESEPPKSVVEGMSDQRMLERHGEVADPRAMARTADELVHNEVRARFVATEFKALKKATGSAKDIVNAAKEAAANAIDARRVRDIAAGQYDSAETRSAKQAEQAMSKGDTAGAAIAKRDQILNMELARAAREAQTFVTKSVEYLKKFDKPSVREAIDLEYRDQIDALLDRADLRKSVTNTALDKREALQSFVERMAGAGYKPYIPEHLLDEAERWHYKDMPLVAFKGLVDAVKSIEHLGKMKSKMLDAKETRELSDLAAEVKESAGKLPQRAPESNRGLSRMEQKWVAAKAFGRSAQASMLKMEQMLDWVDARNANGTLNRVVFRRLSEAGVHENNLLGHVKAEIDKLLNANLADITREKGKVYVAADMIDGATGLPQRFTTKEMLMLAGNMGNASNAAKMAKGERWNETDVWAFLHANMTKAHWDFVAGMGRTLESLWPEKLAMDRRLGNTSPEKIEPRPFTTPHGDYAGWYWPLMYDPARSQDVAERGARQGDAMFENIYAKASTDTGRMNTRNENYARPLLLDLDALPRMIKDEIHDISHREAIIDADRFLSHPTVRKAIIDALSQEHYDQLRPWLQSIANDGKVSTDGARGMEFFNGIAREARMRATMVGLGLRLTTALVHGSSAAAESISELGVKWMGAGLKDFANPLQWSANKDFVFERSGEMRNRMNEVDRDVREHLRQIDLNLMDPASGAVQRGADAMKAHAYVLIAGLDMASALPTWMGAYKKALTPPDRGGLGLGEQDAVYFADKTVRNAHGGTGVKDMARVQRGTEFQKLFTMFYTFWNHNINRIIDTSKLVTSPEHRALLKEQNNWSTTQLASTVILRTLAYTFGVQALHSLINPPKKEDDGEHWMKWAGKEFLASAFAGIPIARDISAHFLTGKDYSVTPAASVVDAIGRTGQDALNALTGKAVSDKWLKHAITTTGFVAGLPLGQPASTAQFIWDVGAGKQHPESAKDWWNGIAHGDVKAHH